MDMVQMFQEFKRVYGFCPCCGEPFRLSDCTLFTRTAPPNTVFDKLDRERERFALAEERVDDKEDELKERARTEGRKAAKKRLRSFMPFFAKQNIDARDIKVLFHPVDYVAFRNLSIKECTEISFIDRYADSKEKDRIQTSLAATIKLGNIEWITLRILDNGNVIFK